MMAHAGRHVRTYAGTGDVRSDSKKEPAHAPESGTTKGYNAKPKNDDAGTTHQQHSAVDAANQQGSSQAPMAGATMDFDGNPTGGDVRSDSKNEPAHAPESGMTKGYNAKPTSDDAGPTNQQRSKLDSAGQQGNLQAPKAGATMDFDGSSTGGDIRSDSQQEPSYAPESGTTKGYNANPKSDDTYTASQQVTLVLIFCTFTWRGNQVESNLGQNWNSLCSLGYRNLMLCTGGTSTACTDSIGTKTSD